MGSGNAGSADPVGESGGGGAGDGMPRALGPGPAPPALPGSPRPALPVVPGERAAASSVADAGGDSALVRARAGIYGWVGRAGRGLLRATPYAIVTSMTAAALAPLLLPMLVAAPVTAVIASLMAQLGNVGAEHVARVLQDVVSRLRGEAEAAGSAGVSEETVYNVLERYLEAELAGPHAPALRVEMTQLLHAVNGVGAALDAAVRSEVEGLHTHIGGSVRELSETVVEFRVLRDDVRSALTALQGDLARLLAMQQSNNETLNRMSMQMAILHRQVAIGLPAERAVVAEPGAAGSLSEPDPDVRPYPGLAAFNEADAFWFHGRDRLIAELITRLRVRLGEPVPLMVVGASGAGKSSVL